MVAESEQPQMQDPWAVRIARAESVRRDADAIMNSFSGAATADEDANQMLESFDTKAMIGSRHHTVPKFLLQRWATPRGQVQVHSRAEGTTGRRNITDLAIKNFYTYIDKKGDLDSSLESLLGVVEGQAAEVIKMLLSPYAPLSYIDREVHGTLAQFAAFQVVRGPRRRREIELQADWYSKTMAQGRIPDNELRELTFVPHQNEHLMTMTGAEDLAPFFICRPLLLITLSGSRMYISDEPVIVSAPDEDDPIHHPDCFLTNEQIDKRNRRRSRKDRKNKHKRGRVVHFSSTVPIGLGVAEEVVIPISPRAALVWGDLLPRPWFGQLTRATLDADESERFAGLVNAALTEHALDWVVSGVDDADFANNDFPKPGPLMRVCDGENVASAAMNMTPTVLRPRRLTIPTADLPSQR